MNRLTMWYDGNHAICENEECSSGDCPFADPICEQVQNIIDRLVTIEDILGDEYDLDELREMVQAKREGRCVVLPCKVEDGVYINILGRTLPFTVISISQMASTPTFKAQHGIRLVYIFKADDVGETVFLTRAEAEAALRREQE